MSKRIVLGIQVINRVKKRTERSRLRVFKEKKVAIGNAQKEKVLTKFVNTLILLW